MAASLSNHSLLPPQFSAYSLKPSKDIKSASLRLQSLYQKPPFPKQISGFSSSSLSFPTNSKNSPKMSTFKASLSAQESARTENVETSAPGLEPMIRVYREALLNGDDRVISEIETRISFIANEKNTLEKQALELSAEVHSGKQKLVRLQDDFDNFRKRSEEERLSTRSDAKGEVMKTLLPMVDSFERAKQTLKPETEKEKKIDASYQGIYKQFVEIMRSLQLAVLPTVGKPFDPSLHEAIGREESQEFKEGIIIQEIRRGFLLGDRLLRPAMVKVSSGPGIKRTVVTDKSSRQPATTGDDQ